MVVGLPGTGIGGLFYILLALTMPLREAASLVSGKRQSLKRWTDVTFQAVNATGIIAGLWGMGWLLGQALQWTQWFLSEKLAAKGIHLLQAAQQLSHVISAGTASLALITLTSVLLLVEIFSILMRHRTPGWNLRARTNAPSAD
ncbi:MAG: hypothetical protein ABSH10_05080 [Phycisphaerae bacterium]|jgi:hypothetical protein